MSSLPSLAQANRDITAKAVMLLQRVEQARNPQRATHSARSLQTRIDHEHEWAIMLQDVSDRFYAQLHLEEAIVYAKSEWKTVSTARRMLRRVQKAIPFSQGPSTPPQGPNQPPSHESVMQRLMAALNSPGGLAVQGALQMYLGQAAETSQHAGQSALDHMGLNKTFAWAHPRNMARDLYSVRGSKVIQNLYGDHADKLTKLIIAATDPRHPQTIQEVKAAIAREWPALQQSAVDRIARTETAAVWTNTSMNAYSANGISQYESIIAHGPTIGIDSEDPCDECIDAAQQVHDVNDDDLPPWHPNCRCEAVPVLEDDQGDPWLPPDEPWAGEDMAICGDAAEVAAQRVRRAILKKMGAVLKQADGECLVPAPEPGGAYGGETYTASPPLDDATLSLLIKEISTWPEFVGNTAQVEVKTLAKRIASDERRKLLAKNAQGEVIGIASYDDGMLFHGYPQTIYVRGIATKGGGGARRVLSQLARQAWREKKALAVDVKGISIPMQKNLEKWGFKKVGTDAYMMDDRAAIKSTFHIEDSEHLPHEANPVYTPVHAPLPGAAGTAAVPAVPFASAAPAEFLNTLSESEKGGFLAEHTAADLEGQKVFLSADKNTGFVVTKDGDLQNLFNNPGGVKGAGTAGLLKAIEEGATTLDCYDGFLPGFYEAKGGFKIVGRMKWNDEYAPPGWDYAKYNHPDVVFMARTEEEVVVKTFAADEWDAAKAYSRSVAEAPDTVESLQAKLKAVQNRIDGNRKKLKTHPHLKAEYEAKLKANLAVRDDLKAKLDKLKEPAKPDMGTPPAIPDKPVVPDIPAPKPPPVPGPPALKAAAYDGRIEVEATASGPLEGADAMEALRDDLSTWPKEIAKEADDLITEVETNEQSVGYSLGLMSLRDENGVYGIAQYAARGPAGFPTLEVNRILMRNAHDVEGYLRGVTQASKLTADEAGMQRVSIFTSADFLHMGMAERADLEGALLERGFVQHGSTWSMEGKALRGEEWLKGEPSPIKATAEPWEDDISVGAGAPVTQDAIGDIKALGLDKWPPDKGTEATKVLMGAKDTKQLFYNYKTKEWSTDRIEKVWTEIVQTHFDGKVPTGTPLYRVEYKNLNTGLDVKTADMSAEDAQAMAQELGAHGVKAEVVQSTPKRTAYFTSGGGGVGKSGSSFLDAMTGEPVTMDELRARKDIVYIDPDAIKELLPEYKAMIGAKDTYAAYGTHEESSAIAKLIQRKAMEQGYSVIIDTTASSETFVAKLLRAKEDGYDVQVSMTSIDTNEAIMRTLSRGKSRGRYVPVQAVKRAHAGASAQAKEWMKSDAVGHWRVYDNSTKPRVLVAEGGAGQETIIHDQGLYDRMLAKTKETERTTEKPAPETPEGIPTAQSFGVEATPTQLRINLYKVENRIAGHKKKLKGLKSKVNTVPLDQVHAVQAQIADFETRLSNDLQLQSDIKAKLVSMGHKPVALKPGAKPATAVPSVEKPVPPKPAPKPVKPKPGEDVPPAKPQVQPKPEPVTEPPQPEVHEPAVHQPDVRRVVPGGITKEKGSTILNKAITEARSVRGDTGMKHDVTTGIVDRLHTREDWLKGRDDVRRAYGYRDSAYNYTADEADKTTVSQLISNWAHSSSDADARAVAIQLAVKEEFGIDVRAFAAQYWNDIEKSDEIVRQAQNLIDGKAWFDGNIYTEAGLKYKVQWETGSVYGSKSQLFGTKAEADAFMDKLRVQAQSDVSAFTKPKAESIRVDTVDSGPERPPIHEPLRAFVREQYNATQADLKARGITEVTVYRGLRVRATEIGTEPGQVGWDAGLSTVSLSDNPIASWSVRHAVARRNHFFGGTMFRASAPAEMVFSTTLTGFGCANEWEVLLLNYADNSAWVAQYGDIALDAERKNVINARISALREREAALARERDKLAPGGTMPEYSTEERRRYYDVNGEINQATYEREKLEKIMANGTEHWTYDKEVDLKNFITEAVTENPSLAGKEIKIPKPRVNKPTSAAEMALRPYKSRITSIKRKITNRQKKIDAYKKRWMDYDGQHMQDDFGISFEDALKMDQMELQQKITNYNLRTIVYNARRYHQIVVRLQADLVSAEQALKDASAGLGKSRYTTNVEKLRRRARVG